ncbi:paired amphipathic helix protein SIN3B (SIN3B) [Vairimorpha necatrix]|uniref:Paired amphipathic helix protein SIN3B (SIN3B) n=1 Tax=Vairimorpha necatrix TaxID=6039 RepID=A0AAX4J8V0_9MICR
MSNLDNNNQDNDKWSEQGSKRYNEDDKEQFTEYSDSSSVSNQHFAQQITHSARPVEHTASREGYQQPRPPVPEDAEVCDAMVFLNKIKEEYADDMVTYDNFLETMRDYKFGKIDADEVCKGVKILFKDKPHLISIFNEYLPSHLKFHSDNRNAENIQRNFDMRPPHFQHPHFRRPLYNAKMLPENMKPNGNMRPMMPKMGPPPHLQPPHMNGLLNGMIPPFVPHPNPMRMPPANKIHPGYYPHIQQKPEEETTKKKQANEFIQRVKRRYSNQSSVYKSFVDILQKNSMETNAATIRSEISTLLWEHPDLIEDFERDFIPADKIKQEERSSALKDLAKEMEERGVSEDFLRCLNYYNQNFVTKKELLLLVTPLVKDENIVEQFKRFINFQEKEPTPGKNLEKCKKIGSYRILNQEIQNQNQDAISREVLNTTCVSMPTFESEDANFVFLKRNMYEDCVFRVEDDRSEATLVVERLDFFINVLEIVYSNLQEGELSIKDLGMSPGIIKEVLKNIYEDSAPEILEGILNNPKTAIPVVIKRLYSINKSFREKLRQKNKVWNEQVERAHYKALDSLGQFYKNQEKFNFSLKNLTQEADEGFSIDYSDLNLIENISKIFKIFIRVSQTDKKQASIPNLYPTVDAIFDMLHENISFVGNFNIFCIFRFIFYAYDKLKEIKDLNFKPIVSSKTAVGMNIVAEYDVDDRFEELINLIKSYSEKSIDHVDYEETVRILTDCKGYKIYNLKKVFLKIEKSILTVMEDEFSLNCFLNRNTVVDEINSMQISFENNIFSAKNIIFKNESEENVDIDEEEKVDSDEEEHVKRSRIL